MRVNLDAAPFADQLRENEQMQLLLKAAGILMIATGIHRLYTKEDYGLFFKRLLLLGNNYRLIDKFFMDETLLSCITKSGNMDISVPDFAKVMGIKTGGAYERAVPDEKWMNALPQMINTANMIGAFSGIVVFSQDFKIEVEGDGVLLRKGDPVPLPDADAIAAAETGALSMLEDLPAMLFSDWKKDYPTAVEEFDAYAAKIASIKQFDFDGLSADAKEIIYNHFRQFFDEQDWDEAKIRKLTHLAWAFANDHVEDDQWGIGEVSAYIDFDERGLELDGGGINLFDTCEIYGLEDLHDLLKDNVE